MHKLQFALGYFHFVAFSASLEFRAKVVEEKGGEIDMAPVPKVKLVLFLPFVFDLW